MKVFCFLVLAMTVALTGCAKTTSEKESVENEATNSPIAATEEKSEANDPIVNEVSASPEKSIEVDKGIFNVTITLPASMFKDQNMDEVIAKAKTDGVGEVIKHDDGSLTYKMTKAKHKEMLKGMADAILENVKETKSGGTFASIKDITVNKTFSEFTISVDEQAYTGSFDAFAAMGFGISGMYYQLFNGASESNNKVTIFMKNADTGKVFDTLVYPDALEKMSP